MEKYVLELEGVEVEISKDLFSTLVEQAEPQYWNGEVSVGIDGVVSSVSTRLYLAGSISVRTEAER